VYRGDMQHRSSVTLAFRDFLATADRLQGEGKSEQLYLAQVGLHVPTNMAGT
jgi:hypothetical protein